MVTRRFLDQNKTYGSFSNHQLVVCPQCAHCADVIVMNPEQKSRPWGAEREPLRVKLTCLHCGYNAQVEKQLTEWYSAEAVSQWRESKPDQPSDYYFHQPLWLQAPCEGHILWAFNNDHLNYIRDYIEADLREKPHRLGQHYSVVNRLPRWAKSARNRDHVLAIIDKMLKRA